jgi:hypothetical protein
MAPRSALSPTMRPKERRRSEQGTDAAKASDKDSAKLIVMACASELVAGGFAEWQVLDTGDILLHFRGGATFLFAETLIRRLA